MKLAVFGSRGFNDYEKLCSVLSEEVIMDELFDAKLFELVSGGAIGADTLAERWNTEHKLNEPKIFKPKYDKYPKHIAPLIRNSEIVDYADCGIAFWDGRSRGTLDTLEKFAHAGKQVTVIVVKKR